MALFYLSILTTKTVFSQKIEGIGRFKVNKTNISIVDSLKKEGYEYKICQGLIKCLLESGKIILERVDEVKPENDRFNDVDLAKFKNHRIIKIGELKISEINIKNIVMDFYNDILISITVHEYSNDFTEALKLKYGNPKIDRIKKNITCSSSFAGSYNLEENSFTSIYRDDSIGVYDYLSVYYNDKCKKQYFQVFKIYDKEKLKIVENFEKDIREKLDKEKKKKQKEALIDL